MRVLLYALAALFLIGIVVFGLRGLVRPGAHSDPLDAGPRDYVRTESDAELTLYELSAEFHESTPADVARFVALISELTGLDRRLETYPTQPAVIENAANAFVEAAARVFSFQLSLEDPEVEQIDTFASLHLVDASLQRYFDADGRLLELSEEEEEYYQASEELRVPDEPLLYYAMGAFWGEWLVRHRNAEWALFEPLRPIQSFPDMVTAGGTLCLHPFSQVGKRLANPSGDALSFKAEAGIYDKRLFRPFCLSAALADASMASTASLPLEARSGLELQAAGDHVGALAKFTAALEKMPDSARLYSLAIPSAWEQEDWNLVNEWHLKALELEPGHPMLNHNLAYLYSSTPELLPKAVSLLERALATDPEYGKAHLTLAECYRELGETEKAIERATWVRDHDYELRENAEGFLRELESR